MFAIRNFSSRNRLNITYATWIVIQRENKRKLSLETYYPPFPDPSVNNFSPLHRSFSHPALFRSVKQSAGSRDVTDCRFAPYIRLYTVLKTVRWSRVLSNGRSLQRRRGVVVNHPAFSQSRSTHDPHPRPSSSTWMTFSCLFLLMFFSSTC